MGYRINDIKSWASLRADTIDAYVGIVALKKMGESLARTQT